MAKQLHEQIDDFKLFKFLWALFKQVIKLAVAAVVVFVLSTGALFLFYLVMLAIIATTLPHP